VTEVKSLSQKGKGNNAGWSSYTIQAIYWSCNFVLIARTIINIAW